MAGMQLRTEVEPMSHDGSEVGVLVCHGFTGNPSSMRPLAQTFVDQGWSVRLPRLPGHGTTWQDLNTRTWEQWYAEVAAAHAELRERCEVVVAAGLSMGGSLVTLLAQDRPEEVDGLILINPAYRMTDPRLRVLPALKHVVGSIPAIGGDIRKPGAIEDAYDRTPLKALHSATRMWAKIAADLPKVTQPVLLLHSPVDHVVDPSNSALLLERISSSDVTEVLLTESFHVATLDHDAPLIEQRSIDFVQRIAQQRVQEPAR
ncbi:alpha/beta hydrolase [Dermacoccaceae bacterium W4C1]